MSRRHVRLRDSPLAGDAFGNQRLAVGGEDGDLGFDAGNDALQFAKFRVEVNTDSFLFGERWKDDIGILDFRPGNYWLRCAIRLRVEIECVEQMAKEIEIAREL